MPAIPKPKSAATPRQPAPATISLADAKAHLSSVISGVQKSRTPITILKRGIPVAQVIPITETAPISGFGCMRGTVQVLGDIVGPTGVEWTLRELDEG